MQRGKIEANVIISERTPCYRVVAIKFYATDFFKILFLEAF